LPKQHTIQKPVSISGKGLHTGLPVAMTILPAAENTGIRFQRTDLPGQPVLPADCDLVTDVKRGTTIELKGVKVSTIEHLLAALTGLGIDNVLVQLNAQELPILNGSAREFIDLLMDAGLSEQDAKRQFIEINDAVHFYDKEKDAEYFAVPYDTYSLSVLVDFESEVIGKQHAQLKDIANFSDEISDARTFCFLHEVEAMYNAGLIKGGDLNNAIVISEQIVPEDKLQLFSEIFKIPQAEIPGKGIVNNLTLHYPNEPARHKLIDIIGDLALVGQPIKAKIFASKPGHASNVAFARHIKQNYLLPESVRDAKAHGPVLELEGIKKLLPHREPFLFIDKILEIGEKHVVAQKSVQSDEPYFKGHFPKKAVMPGVLQIEAMAQTGGILALSYVEDDPQNYLAYFHKIENAKFRHPVFPGDTMVIKMELTHPVKLGVVSMRGIIYVSDTVCTEADLTAKIFKA
jgi:UDP-3-O-[3-hydroxymyristoyl] N-acetylglucosamine deacetylase / 3-hydroxyacyl-[acyl-carrier-protein] dehydratase